MRVIITERVGKVTPPMLEERLRSDWYIIEQIMQKGAAVMAKQYFTSEEAKQFHRSQ